MDSTTAAVLSQLQERIASGPADQVVTFPDGGTIRVRRTPEPGVLMMIESLETHAPLQNIVWEPARERPSGYPAGFPFLSGLPTSIAKVGRNVTLQWHQATLEQAAAVAEELGIDGWGETALPHPSMPGMRIRTFRCGVRQRILIHAEGSLSLLDTRAE